MNTEHTEPATPATGEPTTDVLSPCDIPPHRMQELVREGTARWFPFTLGPETLDCARLGRQWYVRPSDDANYTSASSHLNAILTDAETRLAEANRLTSRPAS